MKCRSFGFVCMITAAILLALNGVAASAYAADYSVSEARRQIIEYKMDTEGYSDRQEFIDGWLTENAGSSSADWYAICLSREEDCDFTSYASALETEITAENLRATDYQRMATAYCAVGGTDADFSSVIDETWNQLGIMSGIYSLILLNSGEFAPTVSETEIVEYILSQQNEKGGWALSGSVSDPDVTAMAVQALSPYMGNSYVAECVENALGVLSDMQLSDGGYKSYGTENSESCAQVIVALCQLGIDPQTDERFIKNGNSVVDALMSYQTESGGFAHISDGGDNALATVQALEAMTALEYSGLYVLHEGNADVQKPEPTTSADNSDDITDSTEQTNPTEAAAENTSQEASEASSANDSTSAQTSAEISQSESSSADSSESAADESSESQSGSAASSVRYGVRVVEFGTVASTSTTPESTSSAAENTETVTSSTGTNEAESSTATGIIPQIYGESQNESDSGGGIGWKATVIAMIILLFAFSQIYLIARRQFTLKKLAVSAAVCSAAILAVALIRIQSTDEYYGKSLSSVDSESMTVNISVSCETISDEISGDFMIVSETETVILDDDTVFDVLERVLASEEIPFDYSGSGADVYIRGIDNIYEMEYGEMSGWMYRVNGEFPDVGCGAYTPEDGDVIEILYTRNIGKDLGMEEYSG